MSHPPSLPPGTPPGPPPQGYSAGYPQGPGAPRTNGKAVASLVVGATSLVLSVCCVGVVGVVAVFLGLRARREIAASQGMQQGEGLAISGIITGALAALISLALIVFVIIALATGNVEYNVDNFSTPT